MSSLLFDDAYRIFMTEQRIRRNSAATIEYYRISLGKFRSFSGNIDVDYLNIELYKAYVLHLLDDTELKSTSVHTYLRAVKAFYNFLINEGFIFDCSRKLKLVRQDRSVIVPLSDEEICRLLDSFGETDRLELRNKCIVALMLDSGLRLGEVIRLRIDDVFPDGRFLIVNGKGNKQRVVPLGLSCSSLLGKYMSEVRAGAPMGSLFLSKYNDKPLTRNAVHCFFGDLKVKTGISRLYPHLLRHTFATLYIIDGGDLETLRCILGHSTITITQVYLHLAANYKLAYRNHCSHLDKLGKGDLYDT